MLGELRACPYYFALKIGFGFDSYIAFWSGMPPQQRPPWPVRSLACSDKSAGTL